MVKGKHRCCAAQWGHTVRAGLALLAGCLQALACQVSLAGLALNAREHLLAWGRPRIMAAMTSAAIPRSGHRVHHAAAHQRVRGRKRAAPPTRVPRQCFAGVWVLLHMRADAQLWQQWCCAKHAGSAWASPEHGQRTAVLHCNPLSRHGAARLTSSGAARHSRPRQTAGQRRRQ